MESISEYDVWDLVELPENKQVIGCKWVFKRKLRANGSVKRYKARLVAQGFLSILVLTTMRHSALSYDLILIVP